MKIRYCHVANSSTTSFTCEACGRHESYYDSVDHTYFDFVMCENEHGICEDEILDLPEGVKLGDLSGENEWMAYQITAEYCPICQFDIISRYDLIRFITKTTKYTRDDALKWLKETNKRRKKAYDHEYIDCACLMLGMSRVDMEAQIKRTFETYKDFMSFVEGK